MVNTGNHDEPMLIDETATSLAERLLANVYSSAMEERPSSVLEDLCTICYTSELSVEPTTQLDCGH